MFPDSTPPGMVTLIETSVSIDPLEQEVQVSVFTLPLHLSQVCWNIIFPCTVTVCPLPLHLSHPLFNWYCPCPLQFSHLPFLLNFRSFLDPKTDSLNEIVV